MLSSHWSKKLGVLLVAVTASTCAYADINSTIEQARQLVNQNKSNDALALLLPYAGQYSGQRGFDYAYALSLMDSGNYREAELVFDRLLGNFPNFHGARLDLARVYIALEQYAKAATQLDQLAATEPPDQAEKEINKLRNTIAMRNRSMRFSRNFSVNTSVGYDSNVNSATVVDDFLGFSLNDQSKAIESDFYQIGAAANLAYALKPNLVMTSHLGVTQRKNSQAEFIDSRVYQAGLGIQRRAGNDQQSLRLSLYQVNLDSELNSRGARVSGVWMRGFSDRWSAGVRGDFAVLRYEDTLSVKDVRRSEFSLLGSRLLGSDGQGKFSVSAGLGHDEPEQDGSRYSRDYVFASTRVSWQFNPSVYSSLLLYYQDSQYDDVFFEQRFTENRADNLYRVLADINWKISQNWTLNHSLAYSFNDTFVDIFEYEKFEAKVRINYQF